MALVTQTNLEEFFRPSSVRQIFTDDGSSTIGPRLAVALQAGSDEAASILGRVPAWNTDEQLQLLVDNDAGIRFAVCKLVMAMGHESKPEWFSDGQSQSEAWRRSAKQTLKDFAERRLRTKAEPQAGENAVNRPVVANARQFEFARRRGNDSSGGF